MIFYQENLNNNGFTFPKDFNNLLLIQAQNGTNNRIILHRFCHINIPKFINFISYYNKLK
jgi:hypothetical protein